LRNCDFKRFAGFFKVVLGLKPSGYRKSGCWLKTFDYVRRDFSWHKNQYAQSAKCAMLGKVASQQLPLSFAGFVHNLNPAQKRITPN